MSLILNTPTKRAFILDDDPDMLDLVSLWLGDLGVESEPFTTFDSFIHAVDHQTVDLIVLDLQMPVTDGMEVLETLADRKIETPVVLLSAMASDLIYNARVVAQHYGVNVIGSFKKAVSSRDFTETVAVSIIDTPNALPTIDPDTLRFEYQPLVSTSSGRVDGVEALVRIHGKPPNLNQIKALETGSQCIELWRATVERTFSDWQRFDNPQLSLSLNISTGLLISKEFRQHLAARCKAYELPISNLVLELTERSFVSEPLPTFQGMCQLRILGARLALDDFGKRFSTLERLRTLPFTDVKFDQELLRRGWVSDITLQRAVNLSQALGFTATAEAVETQEQLDLVNSLGIELAQGYLLSRPMSVDRLIESGIFERSAKSET